MSDHVRDAATAVRDEVCAAGEPWVGQLRVGQIFRIVDLMGNQAVDTLFYATADPEVRYSAADTIRRQRQLYLTKGSRLWSSDGRVMLTIVADTCGRHDTVGGACSAESNSVRYAFDRCFMHSCRDNFLAALSAVRGAGGSPLGKRDITSNVNFFMNVPVEGEKLTFADGVSAPGKYVEMRADMDVTVVMSNCPQLNNPCNAYNPTPIRLLVWDAP